MIALVAVAMLAASTLLAPAGRAGATTAAGSRARLATGRRLVFADGNWTNDFTVGGNTAWCMEPSKGTPDSGDYTVSDFTQRSAAHPVSAVRADAYYGYGGPGFDRSLWPATDWDGSAITDGELQSYTHLLIADRVWASDYETFYGSGEAFCRWFSWNVLGRAYGGGASNPGSVASRIEGRPVPDSFRIFELRTGSSSSERPGEASQVILAWEWSEVTVSFTKTSADAKVTSGNAEYSMEGATYDIFRKSDDSKVAAVTLDANGHADLKLDCNEHYRAMEVAAPKGYKLDPAPIEFRTGTADTKVNLADEPGVVRLSLQKKDSSTHGAAQPGATLEGATYKLVDANGGVHYAESDAEGRVSFGREDKIPLGTVTITETEAPEGYRLDPTVHTHEAGATADVASTGVIELSPAEGYEEDIIAFDLKVVKYKDTGAEGSGLQDAAAGVRFLVISNTTGEEIGSITTGADGSATTDGLWFGSGTRAPGVKGAIPYDAKGYTVREDPATTPAGYQPAPDWKIGTKDMVDGATLSYIVDNDFVATRLQIVKTDAATGQTVPLAGFTFRILDADGNPVEMTDWYPNEQKMTEFATDETGCATLPETLKPGSYTIAEAAAAAPYLLGEPVTLEVASVADSPEVRASATFPDEQAMGRATVTKTCSLDGEPLAGAGYDVVARGDVVSPDGTVRAAAGEVVGHVVTGEDGRATTKDLYLGSGAARYAFVETEAPEGHVLDATPHEFTLSWEDDETPLVEARVEAVDAPTETVLSKGVLGTDDALPGAGFAWWAASDEIGLAPEPGLSALAVRAPEGGDVTATLKDATGLLSAEAPDGGTVRATGEDGGAHEVTSRGTALEPGTYAISLVGGDGEEIPLSGDTEVEVGAGEGVELTFSKRLIGGMTAAASEPHELEEPRGLEWDAAARAYSAADLPAGTYLVSIDGEEAGTVKLEARGTAYRSAERGDGGSWRLAAEPVLLKSGKEPETGRAGEDGTIAIRHLTEGAYRIVETSAPAGYLVDPAVRCFSVGADGLTEGFASYSLKVDDDYTKLRLSKRDATDESEVEGARLALLDTDGEVVDSWTSGGEDHGIDAIAPGRYTLVEEMTPHAYDQATAVEFEVKATGEVQTAVMHDEPIEIGGQVDKRQEVADPTAPYTEADRASAAAEVSASGDGSFDYTLDFRSTSSTWADELTVTDPLEAVSAGLAELAGVTTPVAEGDFDGRLNVWYTTNLTDPAYQDPSGANATLSDGHGNPWLSDESVAGRLGGDGRVASYAGWCLWRADVPADEATDLKVSDLGLAEGELVTGIRFEYGRVEAGFATREGGWGRKALKDARDDLDDASEANGHGGGLAPAVLRMRVTDAYRAGARLENSAGVEVHRNGGGEEGLDDDDSDKVTQSPIEDLPEIGTALTDDADGDHAVAPDGKVGLTDTVAYEGLETGIGHRLSGTLMDKATGEPVKGADGKAVTAEAEFTPEEADGTAEVAFKLDASELAGHDLVAFEELSIEDGGAEGGRRTVAAHEDIDDAGQTVRVSPGGLLDQTGSLPLAALAAAAAVGLAGGAIVLAKDGRRGASGRPRR